jgi:hypothetical protein
MLSRSINVQFYPYHRTILGVEYDFIRQVWSIWSSQRNSRGQKMAVAQNYHHLNFNHMTTVVPPWIHSFWMCSVWTLLYVNSALRISRGKLMAVTDMLALSLNISLWTSPCELSFRQVRPSCNATWQFYHRWLILNNKKMKSEVRLLFVQG